MVGFRSRMLDRLPTRLSQYSSFLGFRFRLGAIGTGILSSDIGTTGGSSFLGA